MGLQEKLNRLQEKREGLTRLKRLLEGIDAQMTHQAHGLKQIEKDMRTFQVETDRLTKIAETLQKLPPYLQQEMAFLQKRIDAVDRKL